MPRSKGISLVELLAVIAMVGIMSGFAYPAYRKYVVKADLTQIYSNGIAIRALVADELIEVGQSDFTGISIGAQSHPAADTITISNGVITMVSTLKVDGSPVTIIMTPSYSNTIISWECTTINEDLYEYLPKDCHNLEPTPAEEE